MLILHSIITKIGSKGIVYNGILSEAYLYN